MSRPRPDDFDWLASAGEMAALIRSHDWSSTPIGPPGGWPQSLRTAVSICLDSRFPMLIWWGPEAIQIYNDGYRPVLGAKHPTSLGQSGPVCWAEIWDVVGPMYDRVRATGESTWSEDLLLVMERHGYVEETYFTFSYSAIRDERGEVNGVLVTCVETTQRVLSERRLHALRDLSLLGTHSQTVADTYRLALAVIADHAADIPAAVLYALDEHGATADPIGLDPVGLDPVGLDRVGSAGLDPAAAPTGLPLAEAGAEDALTSLARAAWQGRTVGPVEVEARPSSRSAADEPWAEERFPALAQPISRPGQPHPYAVLVTLLSPNLALDGDYRSFLELVAGHIANAVADVRSYEEERRRAESLAELDRAKTLFFNNVSHEFRTPLTLMLGPIEDLLRTNLPPGTREQIELVQRAGLRLKKLVNTLLDFASIEAGRSRASYRPTDLAVLTADLASTFRSLIERTGLGFAIDCPPLPEPVYVDRDMWEKVVLNLLSNAFKYTHAGRIGVRLGATSEHAVLQVTDTGVGIPEADLPRLFDRFHRVENARGRSEEGSGIGLALVRELVLLHGGEITVASAPDEGSTFTVRVPFGRDHLPAEDLGDAPAPASTALGVQPFFEEARRWLPDGSLPLEVPSVSTLFAEEGDDPNKPYVLVADDNADMRLYLHRLLSPFYRVETVADGRRALDLASRREPELILSDVMMPSLDGFGLLRALRDHPRTKTVPVIFLSARAGEEERVEGLDAGADDYLVKPFSAQELLASVRVHVEMGRVRREAAEAERRARDELEQRVVERTHTVRTLASRLTLAEQEERHRIARRLHDELQQQLYAVQFALHGLDKLPDGARSERLEQALELLKDAFRMARQVTTDLSPPVLRESGLAEALRWLAGQMQERYGLEVTLKGDLEVPTHALRLFLFGLVRELLFNVVKHAGVDRATVTIGSRDADLELTIADDGAGFDLERLEQASSGTGLGLAGVRERLDFFDGRLGVDSTPGRGTRVTIRMPLRPASLPAPQSRD